jgi:tRNA G26 N,N-dimethylase Trm1
MTDLTMGYVTGLFAAVCCMVAWHYLRPRLKGLKGNKEARIEELQRCINDRQDRIEMLERQDSARRAMIHSLEQELAGPRYLEDAHDRKVLLDFLMGNADDELEALARGFNYQWRLLKTETQLVDALQAHQKHLSDENRVKLWAIIQLGYCRHCGRLDPEHKCQCENDE